MPVIDLPRPLVGIGVMIIRDRRVLLGQRRGAHGVGEFAFPGGHLEHGESFADCARREVEEECGLAIANIRFQFVANVLRYSPRHYVHIGLIADWQGGEPQLREPEKCAGWEWCDAEHPPSPLFEMCHLAFVSRATGQTCFDVSS